MVAYGLCWVNGRSLRTSNLSALISQDTLENDNEPSYPIVADVDIAEANTNEG